MTTFNEGTPLRICKLCGLKTYTKADLNLFTKDENSPYGRRNCCKKCTAKLTRKYYQKNKEKIKRYNQKYRQEHKEELKEYHKKYRQEHKEKIKKRNKKYHQKHREKIIEWNQNRRKEVLDVMGGKCVYCGCDRVEALQINHKYGGGRQDPAGTGTRLIGAILHDRRKTDDLEIACYVCNAWHKLVTLDGLPDGWTITWEDPNEL